MAIDPRMLTQVLRTPRDEDVTASPIVRAVILGDPSNAADLVGALPRAHLRPRVSRRAAARGSRVRRVALPLAR